MIDRDIKMRRLAWKQLKTKEIPGSIWKDMDETKINYDRPRFENHYRVLSTDFLKLETLNRVDEKEMC